MRRFGIYMMWMSLMPLFAGIATGKDFHYFTAFMAVVTGIFAYKKGKKAEVKIKSGLNKAVNTVSDVTEVKESEDSQYKLMLVAAMVALFVAIFDMPSGYYDFLRIVVFITTGLSAFYFLNKEQESSTGSVLLLMAILWNPIIPIWIYDKSTWVILDLIAVGIIAFIINNKSFSKSTNDPKPNVESKKTNHTTTKSPNSNKNTSASSFVNTSNKDKNLKNTSTVNENLYKLTLGELFKKIKNRKIDHNNFVKKYHIHIFNFIIGAVLGDSGYKNIDEADNKNIQHTVSLAKKEFSDVGIYVPEDLSLKSQIDSILNQTNKEHAIIIKNILDLNKFGFLMTKYRKNGNNKRAESTINSFIDACINNLSFDGNQINKTTK